jgi:hypothetical protein
LGVSKGAQSVYALRRDQASLLPQDRPHVLSLARCLTKTLPQQAQTCWRECCAHLFRAPEAASDSEHFAEHVLFVLCRYMKLAPQTTHCLGFLLRLVPSRRSAFTWHTLHKTTTKVGLL